MGIVQNFDGPASVLRAHYGDTPFVAQRTPGGPFPVFDTGKQPAGWNGTTNIVIPASPAGTYTLVTVQRASGNLASGTSGALTATRQPSGTVLVATGTDAIVAGTDYITNMFLVAANTDTGIRLAHSGGTAGGQIQYRIVQFKRAGVVDLAAGGFGAGFHSPLTRGPSPVAIGSPIWIEYICWQGTGSGSHPLAVPLGSQTITVPAGATDFLSQVVGGIPQRMYFAGYATAATFTSTVTSSNGTDWFNGGWKGSTV